MMGLFISILLSIFLGNCTHIKKNLIKKGELKIVGGKHQGKNWNDSLKFKRFSWYKGAILQFDLIYTSLNQSEPFIAWASQQKKKVSTLAPKTIW